MSIRLIIFDLGRVLVRICDDWLHACREAGIARPFNALDASTRAAMHELVVESEVGKIDQATFCQRAAALFGAEPAHVQSASTAYLLGAYPGAADLVNEVMRRGFETACLSNTNTHHWSLMLDPSGHNALPLEKMTYRFASQLVGHRKPDDAIYAHVERTTGKRPEQILFFDDNADNVAAADRRGWNTLLIQHDGDPVAQMRRHLGVLGVLE